MENNTVDTNDVAIRDFMVKSLRIDKPFLDEPIIEDGEVVDNLTPDGDAGYGRFTNALYDLGELLDKLYPNDGLGEKISDAIDRIDYLVNMYRGGNNPDTTNTVRANDSYIFEIMDDLSKARDMLSDEGICDFDFIKKIDTDCDKFYGVG